MGEWTKEPWCVALAPYDEDEIEVTTEDRERQDVIPICLVKVGYRGPVENEQRANIPRILACVNAMTGIEDPAATMKEVVEVLEAFCPPALSEMEQILWGEISDDEMGSITISCGQMRRARALLAKLGRG